jgi:hypothetical protein
MVAHLGRLQQLVEGSGASLLLFGDNHLLANRGSYCAARASLAAACDVSLATTRERLAVEHSVYERLVAEGNRTHYLAISELLCDTRRGVCGAYVPGTTTLAMADADHLTVEASLYLWPFLCAFIDTRGLLGT